MRSFIFKSIFISPSFPPSLPFQRSPTKHLCVPLLAGCILSEGHELKLPLSLPLWQPHWVGGMLLQLHPSRGCRHRDWHRHGHGHGDLDMLVPLVMVVAELMDRATHYLQVGKEGEEKDRTGGQGRLARGKRMDGRT